MKKLIATLICILCLTALCVIGTAAATQEAGYWVENAENIEEILAGEAGEREIGWEVPFLHIAPSIDGSIDKNEYMPFEQYQDYLSWMAPVGTETDGTTEEEFKEFYDSTQIDFFDAWWGWDGTYLYVAFEINCINGYKCDPEQDVLLYAYNCLQLGIADVNATGKDASYVELGCGVHSETGDQITFNWSGNYCPKAGEDFVGSYDAENQVLIYEMRVHLQSALGLDRVVENGDEMNYAWILAVNGQAQTTNETWQLAFCHGIGGQYSGKCTQYFARVAFTGKPDGLEIKPVEIPGMSDEDKEYGLMEFIDLSQEDVAATFEGENAAVDFITEGDESFLRITALATGDDIAYAYSNKYPKNVLNGQADYVVVKYRSSFSASEDLGIIFRNVNHPEFNLDDPFTEVVGYDGEWHVVLFYMMDDPTWNHFIMNMGFIPFPYADGSAQQTLDIAWIKVYQQDPFDLYEELMYDDSAATETEAPAEGTQAPAEETQAPADGTQAPAEGTQAPTEGTEGGDKTPEDGCASVVGMGTVAILAAAAAAVALRKKDD